MKKTMDLPEDWIREMKFRSAREGRNPREVAEEALRRGWAAASSSAPPGARHRLRLPIIPASPGARPFELTGERLMELEWEAEMMDGCMPRQTFHISLSRGF
ncbi:MAG: hypothetical protein MUF86_13375 [Akkermansiaceae bacterium]|jgi:hypothetical protein|nr:hypothetical protein [Akkermansiaceae bacterium]MCU0778639.1 hypothetical protein [Akkermansiaceae bacterium]